MLKIRLNLRKVVAIAICLAGSVTMSAQDIIVMKNGNEIQAVVQEVGVDVVKYKKYDNLDGPIYIKLKSEVFMIKYATGSKDVFSEARTPSLTVMQQRTTVNQQRSLSNGLTDSQQEQPVLKYMLGQRISPNGSEKSPFLAGFLSFLIPGVGQFYNGDVGGGFLFLGSRLV